MSDQTTETTVEAPSVDSHEGSDAHEVTTPDDGPEAPQGHREARYRVERNDAVRERDTLAQRLEALQTRELERIASKSLAHPADLLTLSGKTLADLLDDDGEVDAVKVQALADEVLGTRPGLKARTLATDPTQGGTGSPGIPAPSWGNLLQS